MSPKNKNYLRKKESAVRPKLLPPGAAIPSVSAFIPSVAKAGPPLVSKPIPLVSGVIPYAPLSSIAAIKEIAETVREQAEEERDPKVKRIDK